MAPQLRKIVTAEEPAVRNRSLEGACRGAGLDNLLDECADLERFRGECDNLYQRVRALFFLYALHRFHLLTHPALPRIGAIPYEGVVCLLQRRFDEAVQRFLARQAACGPSETLSSALAAAYRELAFQTLADQVRRSVRGVAGNRWMFRVGHPADHPLRLRPELLRRPDPHSPFPVLRERTPVRMDLTHSAWSDIFFLGMDYPEGARVLNVFIDLGVLGQDAAPRPPVEVYLRVIDEPVLRLVSTDLGASADVTSLAEVFDFAKDYLGLLKAALIASGVIPPGLEGSGGRLTDVLARLIGPGLGLEVVSGVNRIPKGSRLAVSTTLLAALIAACMRATGQAGALTGSLSESERRLVAARAILGEWLGGSGGGWQDSGGVWPGVKLIEGVAAREGDPEFDVSRGRLLPRHTVLGPDEVPESALRGLKDSLILVHGGLAQNVGPLLEMVTERYLLRSEAEWRARHEALGLLDGIRAALARGDVRALGAATTRNFEGPIRAIIPWASNCYTETLIGRMRGHFADDFWGFWMLGGMSGGGMGFLVAPGRKAEAQRYLRELMLQAKRELQHALPFAMDPVVYDFDVNDRGTRAELLDAALLPAEYYLLQVPAWLRQEPTRWTPLRRAELSRVRAAGNARPELAGMAEAVFDRLCPVAAEAEQGGPALQALLRANGFDPVQHERVRSDLRRGLIGLAQNRLPPSTAIEDVRDGDVVDGGALTERHAALGREFLSAGAVAAVTLAAGAGSRWTQGAGVVKALHPFAKLGREYRSFLEIHLAKSRRVGRDFRPPPHVFTASYLTQAPVEAALSVRRNYGYPGSVHVSPGRSVGLRLVPMTRDLTFVWEEMAQQRLDEQAQKVRDSQRAALLEWASRVGEGEDYTDNLPAQCLHPVGHWYEVANLLRNGVLRGLLRESPRLKYLFVHNIDTLGANLDPALLGLHADRGTCLTFEVMPRRFDDRGGGLSRVDGRVRLVEGLALPREEDEFGLRYYNTMNTWVDVDRLLAAFGLVRDDLADEARVAAAVRRLAARLPTYVALKEVKKRWGRGQEDVYPVCQFEKLWGDMTALPEVRCGFVAVSRQRGQQLKEQAQLDGWLREGSAAYVESLCDWDRLSGR